MSGVASARRTSLVTNSAVLSVTILGVSAGNYLLNVALARLLDPAQFGDANLAINLVLASALVAASLQLAASKLIAANPDRAAAARRVLVRLALIVGAAAFLVLALGAEMFSSVLRTSESSMFAVLGAALPLYFVQSVYRGILQGQLRIGRLSLSYAIEAIVRVALALVLVWAGWGVIGTCVAILVSFAASALVARTATARGGAVRPHVPWSAVGQAIGGATVLMAGQVVISNSDLVLSKMFFDPATAGVYAAAALIGRASFFVSWSIVQAVFPVAAAGASSPRARRRALRAAVLLVAALGVAAAAVVAVAGPVVVEVMFGPGYQGAVPLVLPYVVATSLFAVANVVAAVSLAVGRMLAPALLLAGAALQVALLLVFGATPAAMVWTQVGAMALTAGAVALAWIVAERRVSVDKHY